MQTNNITEFSINTESNQIPVLTGTPAILDSAIEGNSYVIKITDLLQGFTDGFDILRVINLQASNGTLVSKEDEDYTYRFTPNANFYGTVDLTYQVSDGRGGVVAANNSFVVEKSKEFRVNTYTNSEQNQSSITTLTDGGFVVAWSSNGQDGSGVGVYGQRYSSSGVALGTEFRVNTAIAGDQNNSAITALSDGGFVITWSSVNNAKDIYAQRYSSIGVAVGTEFRVNTTIAGDQNYSAITALSDGGFIVTWSSTSGSDKDVYAQRYDSNSTAVGTEFRLNKHLVIDNEYYPRPATNAIIVNLTDGGFVAVWEQVGDDQYDIHIQRYDQQGIAIGNELVTFVQSYQPVSPVVAALNDGGFVVMWSNPASDAGIFGQRYNGNGQEVGSYIHIANNLQGNEYAPAVTGLVDGGFVVTWTGGLSGYPNPNGIYGQRLNNLGVKVGGEFLVSTFATGNPQQSSITALDDGGFVVTWQSSNQDGSGTGIYGQRFDANGQAVVLTTTPSNQAPIAQDDQLVIVPFSSFDINVLANDSDPENDTLTVISATNSGYQDDIGEVITITNDNKIRYASGYAAGVVNDVITYVVQDSFGNQTQAKVYVTIEGEGEANHAPILSGQQLSLSDGMEDTAYILNTSDLLQGFTDIDGDSLTLINLQVTNGMLVNNQNGTYTFTPNTNFSGMVNLSYQVSDSQGGIVNATQSFTLLRAVDTTGTTGADELVGSAENDVYIVNHVGDVIVEDDGGIDTILSSVTYSLNNRYIEHLTLTGTDHTKATGNNLDNLLMGNSGNNTLYGGTGKDSLDGGLGADVLSGGYGDDLYYVDNVGDDVINERVDGGGGIDTILSSVTYSLDNRYVEHLTLTGADNSKATGNNLDNLLMGNSGNNTLYGGTGKDSLDGGLGADVLSGGYGDDLYHVDNVSDDVINERVDGGIDTIFSSVYYTLYNRYVENLTLTGTANVNAAGNNLNNILSGNSGNNILYGGTGSDTYLFGMGSGQDVIRENTGTLDILSISGVAKEQLWFSRVGNDLEVRIIGTTDKASINNWYLSTVNQLEEIRTVTGDVLLSSQVQNLVTAMSSFSPPPVGTTTLDSGTYASVLNAIAASW